MTTMTLEPDTATETTPEPTPGRTPFVFEIREEKFEELELRFAKMVKRAKKCKLPAPSFSILWEADEKRVKNDINEIGERVAVETWVRYLYVSVEGERPTLAGWDFVATVDHTEAGTDGSGNVIKAVPGAGEIPVAYRNAFPVCDHCKTARNRHETFIVRRSEDPSVAKQVGRNCLQDFFPGASPSDVAQQLAWWTEAVEMLSGCGDDEDYGGGGRTPSRYGIEALLHTTQACIESFGWTSRTKARESIGVQATADRVEFAISPPKNLTESEKKDLEKIREHHDVEKNTPVIEAALAWVREIDPSAAEDYLYNLHVVCKGESVREDRMGLACSLLPAYRRFVEGEREKREHAANPSEYVGTVGVRGLFPGCTMTFISEPYESSFGTTTRLTFTQGPNVLIWWASNPGDFAVGDTYDIVATPKKHEEYANVRKGTVTKQTIVSRVAVATDKDRKKFAKKNSK